jgi:integrase
MDTSKWTKDKLTIRSYAEGKKKGFQVLGRLPGGAKVRKRFPSKTSAEVYLEELIIKADNIVAAGSQRFTQITRQEEQDALAAFQVLSEKLSGWSLVRAAQFCHDNYAQKSWTDISFEEACEEFIGSLRDLARTEGHINDYQFKCEKLTSLYSGQSVSTFTRDNAYNWVFSKKGEPTPWPTRKVSKTTRNKERTFLRSFFKFCKGRKWIPENPVDESIPSPGNTELVVEAFSIPQVKRLIEAALSIEPEVAVPYFALGLFAAIRPDETRKLDWSDFRWKDKGPSSVIINAKGAKKNQRRVVELPETCVAWIKPYAKDSGPLVPYKGKNDFRVVFDTVRARAGFRIDPKHVKNADPELAKICYRKDRNLDEYIHDGLRHTGITYRLEATGDINRVSLWAGNSPNVIRKHYKDIVVDGDEQVKQFYGIQPETTNA